jgi:hypothetical protein
MSAKFFSPARRQARIAGKYGFDRRKILLLKSPITIPLIVEKLFKPAMPTDLLKLDQKSEGIPIYRLAAQSNLQIDKIRIDNINKYLGNQG